MHTFIQDSDSEDVLCSYNELMNVDFENIQIDGILYKIDEVVLYINNGRTAKAIWVTKKEKETSNDKSKNQ